MPLCISRKASESRHFSDSGNGVVPLIHKAGCAVDIFDAALDARCHLLIGFWTLIGDDEISGVARVVGACLVIQHATQAVSVLLRNFFARLGEPFDPMLDGRGHLVETVVADVAHFHRDHLAIRWRAVACDRTL